MHYSVGVGHDLFRVDAVVQEASLAKHESVIMHMIMSFKAPADLPAPGIDALVRSVRSAALRRREGGPTYVLTPPRRI